MRKISPKEGGGGWVKNFREKSYLKQQKVLEK